MWQQVRRSSPAVFLHWWNMQCEFSLNSFVSLHSVSKWTEGSWFRVWAVSMLLFTVARCWCSSTWWIGRRSLTECPFKRLVPFRCPFGRAGLNCNDSERPAPNHTPLQWGQWNPHHVCVCVFADSLLIVVVVSCVLGSCILVLVATLAAYFSR